MISLNVKKSIQCKNILIWSTTIIKNYFHPQTKHDWYFPVALSPVKQQNHVTSKYFNLPFTKWASLTPSLNGVKIYLEKEKNLKPINFLWIDKFQWTWDRFLG